MITRRGDLEQEEKRLAPYACQAARTRGRDNPIAPDLLRTCYQRDRDRIIHCSAFRKLEFKTQVFVVTAGDYHRTRLTHSMEVAQIGRTLARAFGLNPDLTEAIALAHDLGHTPFGHAGEEAMSACMAEHGGFEHNTQSLRIVEYIEERYPEYPGLNLTWEVREGIIKHDTTYDKPAADTRFLPDLRPTLEAQVCDVADQTAYNCADLDDALKMGYLNEDDLGEIPWLHELFESARQQAGVTARHKYVRYRAIGNLYDAHVEDILSASAKALEESGVASVDEVREYPDRLIRFSDEFREKLRSLQQFLMNRVYMHPKTVTNSERGKKFIRELFQAYLGNTRLLPFKYQGKVESEGAHRVICDYISGMTDRYLHEQYRGLFHPEVYK